MEETPEKKAIRKAFRGLNERDRDLFMQAHTEDVVLHHAGGEICGVDALTNYEWAYMDGFPDLEYEIEDLIQEGDRVAVRHRAIGTHDGELMGVAPTGNRVEVSVMIMFRMEENRVAEGWLLADRLGMLRQMGVIEDPTKTEAADISA